MYLINAQGLVNLFKYHININLYSMNQHPQEK